MNKFITKKSKCQLTRTKKNYSLIVTLIAGISLTISACTNIEHSNNTKIVNSDFTTYKSALAAEIDLVAALSQIKDLQYTYAQYGQYGLWDEMTSLFSDSAEINIIRHGEENREIKGKKAINDYLMSFGNGKQGLPVGWLNNEIFMQPVVTLTGDGAKATGRWQTLNMRGKLGGEAHWSGGFQINDYVKEQGVWKLAKVNIHEQFEGSYETGWFAVGTEIPFIPYHYSAKEAGSPIPLKALKAAQTLSNSHITEQELKTLSTKVTGLVAEDAVRRMQNIYGYYADRKMWDDVADLFMEDAVYEIAGVGIYRGAKSIRRGLEQDGPIGLKAGQVHDLLQMHTLVDVDPNGVEARVRGMQWGFLTPKLGEAYFSVSTFDNRYVLHQGIWRISEMRVFPKMKTDYYQGWHKNSQVLAIPTGELAPDKPSPASRSPQTHAVIPAFFDNPVTGKPVEYPKGFSVVGSDRLVAAKRKAKNQSLSVEQIQNKLKGVKAIDAIENISSTFAYYLDDYQWQRYAENYAPKGWRRKGWGEVYEGPEAIYKVESLGYGPSPTWGRDWIRPHTRVQPVIDLNADGESAYIRTRMILYFANSRSAGAFNSGMYPNDSAQLVNGVWKMNVGGWIDETYFRSQGYKLGWAKPNEKPAVKPQGFGIGFRQPVDPNDKVAAARKALGRYPPNLDPAKGKLGRRAYGVVRGQAGYVGWPDIKPMWFHYKNPVSGRVPEFYCADAKVCVNEPMDEFLEQLKSF